MTLYKAQKEYNEAIEKYQELQKGLNTDMENIQKEHQLLVQKDEQYRADFGDNQYKTSLYAQCITNKTRIATEKFIDVMEGKYNETFDHHR
jgi:hypothetical protein